MAKESEESDTSTRRAVLTHFVAVFSGWFIGTFLDPLRRIINRAISSTPFGREADIGFAYGSFPMSDEMDYMVRIANVGEETAEDLAAHLAFKEEITGYEVRNWNNAPPTPETEVEISENGIARVRVNFVRRNYYENFEEIQILFSIDEGTESGLAYKIEEDTEMFTAYRYSWTFLGERYYESTEHHIIRADE